MRTVALWTLLSLVALPAFAAGKAASPPKEVPVGSNDEERLDDRQWKVAEAPREKDPDDLDGDRNGRLPRAPAGPEAGRPVKTRLSLDLGGGVLGLAGLAQPKLALAGASDSHGHWFGHGAAFQLHADFVAMDLDWRLGMGATLPGYLGLGATVGVAKDVGPWDTVRLITRGGGGLEMLMASGAGMGTFLVPVFAADGEVVLQVPMIPKRLDLGAVLDLGVRYGLPLGVGLRAGGFLRVSGPL